MKGWLFGALDHEDVLDVEGEDDPEWGPMTREIVASTYSTERFVCAECGLVLDGHEELAIGGLPPSFTQEEEHEPDYEPDYGND